MANEPTTYDEAAHLVHRAFCDPDHELVGEWDRSMAEALARNGYALVRVFEGDDGTYWQAVNDQSGRVTTGKTPEAAARAQGPDSKGRDTAEAGELDAAWKAAEAELPEGWYGPDICDSLNDPRGRWEASATPTSATPLPGENVFVYGPTPAAALRALAARLAAASAEPPEEGA